MGYNFPDAKTKDCLNLEQLERYNELRTEGAEIPLALQAHYPAMLERVGPLTSGDIIMALEELIEDAVVRWVLSGEDPNIEWVRLSARE